MGTSEEPMCSNIDHLITGVLCGLRLRSFCFAGCFDCLG